MKHDVDPFAVLREIEGLESTYPGFREWFVSKVVPGIDDGSRRIIADVVNDAIIGLVIAKRTSDERKICTLWRHSERNGSASGSELVREAMSWLGTDRPSFTVPSDRVARLRPVLNDLGVGNGVNVGRLYRPGVDELLFNADRMAMDV